MEWPFVHDLQILRKQAYLKYTEYFSTKNWKFTDRKILIFFIVLLKTDYKYYLDRLTEAVLTGTTSYVWRGGSNEYLQSMFLSRNKKKCLPL